MTRQDEVLVALRRIIRATDQNSKRLGRSTGLTVPQIVLMRAIAANPGATAGFLTAQVSLSQATVSTILDRLEERGLVTRQRNARDKRVVNVALTDAGLALLQQAPAPLQESFRARFDMLPGNQRQLIVQALDTVATMMGAGDLDAAPILTLGNIPEQLPSIASTALLRSPTADDGPALHALVRACPPLDENSRYCNLLQCTHFADTTVVAEHDGRLVGAITGYRLPARPDTLFVWQVATHPDARGEGLGRRMLAHLLARDSLHDVTHVETTVTAGNAPSAALFEAFARAHGCAVARSALFDRERHLGNSQDSEWLLRIGPLAAGNRHGTPSPATSNPFHQTGPEAHTGT